MVICSAIIYGIGAISPTDLAYWRFNPRCFDDAPEGKAAEEDLKCHVFGELCCANFSRDRRFALERNNLRDFARRFE
jgi:hypothetical protein